MPLPNGEEAILFLIPIHLISPLPRELDLSSNSDEDFKENVIMDYSYLPDIADDASITSSAIGPTHKKAKLPTLPVNDVALSSKGLTQEIELALKALAVNLFALFTKGSLGHFKKLFAVFVELDNLRTGFENQLLTNYEVQLANRECAYLLTKISKIAAAANLTIYENSSVKKSKDISGSECILARDENSGELFTNNTEESTASPINPAKLALSQVFCALAPNYPVINSNTPLIPPKNDMLDQKPPAHILVDFQAVEGSSNLVPTGYAGMTAYLYLRNSKKRLTESFALSITPDEQFSLESISAALFKNIPANEIDNGRIYLVALLTETIKLQQTATSQSAKMPGLKTVKKGICAGAVDISRIFSRNKGHLQSGEAHQFTIKMFSSYMNKETQDLQLFAGMNTSLAISMTMPNNGWGELVDRVISGSSKGVAVNPRAEKLILMVKEIRSESFSSADDAVLNDFKAVDFVKTMSFNPLDESYDRVYLRVIKTNNIPITQAKPFISVELSSSSQSLLFSKGTNEKPTKKWQFTSTSPDEYISEVIQITGLPKSPNGTGDHLFFDVYVNGKYVASAKYPMRQHNQIFDTSGLFNRRFKSLDLYSPQSAIPIGTIDFDLEYVGKHYNVDSYVEMVLNWKKLFRSSIVENQSSFIATLQKLRKVGFPITVKYFPELVQQLLEIYSMAIDDLETPISPSHDDSNKFDEGPKETLASVTFEAIVQVLDVTIARQDEYVFLFDELLKLKLPLVGEFLVEDMNRYFENFETTWNSTGRALCRVAALVLNIANHCVSDQIYFQSTSLKFSKHLTSFLASEKENVVADQITLIDNLELVLDASSNNFDVLQLIKCVSLWSDAIALWNFCLVLQLLERLRF
ncbi:unnamed protein product [Ambrosiozyma monospora]|uniref:Unnamed protein product n=1 Tax=Ambrosiozyma monospora TaxID=43982 RepID=A0ACB5SZ45_AMBMO|nr:unnamed protein product [Ambrosiozyma monospora]